MKKPDIHQKIQKKMLLYLDGDLEEAEAKKVHNHIKSCPACSRRLEIYMRLWRDAPASEKPAPSQRLWNNIQARLDEVKEPRTFSFQLREIISRYAYPLFMVIMVCLAVAAGAAIGSFGRQSSLETSADFSQSGAISKELELGLFDIAPPGSITEIFDGAVQNGRSRK